MAFKLFIVAATLAYANAGFLQAAAPVAHYSPASAVSSSYISQASPAAAYAAPVAYAAAPVAVAHAAPVAIHAPAIGQSHQSVLRSLGGNQAVSHYSKAVDSAFSSVRKYDTRVTNDALTAYAHAPVAVAHAAPVFAPQPLRYAAPVQYASPVGYAAAPVITKTVAPAAVHYSPAAVVSHVTFSGLGVNYGW